MPEVVERRRGGGALARARAGSRSPDRTPAACSGPIRGPRADRASTRPGPPRARVRRSRGRSRGPRPTRPGWSRARSSRPPARSWRGGVSRNSRTKRDRLRACSPRPAAPRPAVEQAAAATTSSGSAGEHLAAGRDRLLPEPERRGEQREGDADRRVARARPRMRLSVEPVRAATAARGRRSPPLPGRRPRRGRPRGAGRSALRRSSSRTASWYSSRFGFFSSACWKHSSARFGASSSRGSRARAGRRRPRSRLARRAPPRTRWIARPSSPFSRSTVPSRTLRRGDRRARRSPARAPVPPRPSATAWA